MNKRQLQNEKIRKKNLREKKRKASRIYTVLAFFMISLFYLGGKVVFLKVVHGEEYERKAITQPIKTNERIITPNRGAILDRNKKNIAVSSTVYTITIDPYSLARMSHTSNSETKKKEQEKIIKGINEVLDISIDELNEYTLLNAEGEPVNTKRDVVIAEGISRKTAMLLQEKNLSFVYLREDTKRTYFYDNLAAQVIGFIRAGNSWGLEQQYDKIMTGTPGRRFNYYNESNDAKAEIIQPEEGNSLITTLDMNIQRIAEDVILKVAKEYEPQNAAVVVMNPMTGELLAMAEYPSFNVSKPTDVEGLNDRALKEIWDSLSEKEQFEKLDTIWTNYNITSTYEPGSIFKPMVAAAALEEGVISKEEGFFCGGIKYIGSEDSIECWHRPGHGNLNIEGILMHSCNVGIIDVATKMGRDTFFKYQRDFGFGETTGIDLPWEMDSSIERGLMYSLAQLNPVELATSSMGQGFNCTSIQVLSAFSAVINGGNLMKPYVVSQIVDKNGNVIKQNEPTITRKVISKKTSDYLRESLQKVVSPTGTGKNAVIEGYSIGGKTGTAQVGKRDDGNHTVTFIGYLPVENPELIALALINRPSIKAEDISGGASAAPMLREILYELIKYRSIKPSSIDDISQDGLSPSSDEFIMEDYKERNLSEVIKILNSQELNFQLIGPGGRTISSQMPNAGAVIDKSVNILLTVTSDGTEDDLVSIPDVTNLPISQAQEMLTASGFNYIIHEEPEQTENDENETDQIADMAKNEKVVYEQQPLKEIKVEIGTEIKLKVK